MVYKSQAERLMAKALTLARKGQGYTSPNPAVGCVIVRNGELTAGGYHRKAGFPHAEIVALRSAGEAARGADMYVTLEPCCVYGRTPPCTEAIIKAGIRRVFIGALDPNPAVNGQGAEMLRRAGIEVITGILEQECKELNRGYNKYITTGYPYVIAKYAQSLDGRLAARDGSSQWISAAGSLKLAHRLRAQCDAVLIGAHTANTDDPLLTARRVKGKNPVRVILSASGRLANNLKLLNDNAAPTIIATSDSGADYLKSKMSGRVETMVVPRNGEGLDLDELLRQLARREITSLLIEGGGGVITSFLRHKLVDRVIIVTAPIFIGEGINAVGELNIKNIKDAVRLINVNWKKSGPDFIAFGDLH